MKTVFLNLAIYCVFVLFAVPCHAEHKISHEHDISNPIEEEVDGKIIRRCPTCGEIIEVVEKEKEFSLGVDAGFFDKYVSRGLNNNDDWVFQPYVWASYKNLTASVWGNLDLTNYGGNRGEFTELDLILDYSWKWEKARFSVGGIQYFFPNTTTKKTAEAYIGAGYDIILNPKLYVYYDFVDVDGFYSTLSISHSFDLSKYTKIPVSADLSAQVGWGSRNFNSYNFGSRHNTFTDFVATVSLPVTIVEHVVARPIISYSTVLDRTIRTKNEHNDNVIAGGLLSFSY